jgi:DNA-binding protein H-NS
VMESPNLETMPIDELWDFYAYVGSLLAKKLTVEKRNLEQKLGKLRGDVAIASPRRPSRPRRRYPEVRPKYQNPDNPSQTWTGRGRTPRWVTQMLETGKRIEDLLIP